MEDELNKYRAIGTVEECRDARERQRAKKAKQGKFSLNGKQILPQKYNCIYSCQNCLHQIKIMQNYCDNCGQAIDWR